MPSQRELSEPLMPPVSPFRGETQGSPWRSWLRPAMTISIVVVLVALGIANVVMRAGWHEVEDGVLWADRAEGVTALEVAPGSAGDAAGVVAGDLLLAVNGTAVESPADVIEYQHRGRAGTTLSYTLLRL